MVDKNAALHWKQENAYIVVSSIHINFRNVDMKMKGSPKK